MHKTVAWAMMAFTGCVSSSAQTMETLWSPDVILIGRVSADTSLSVTLSLLEEPDGAPTGTESFGLYEVQVSQTIRGTASGTIKVVAPLGDNSGVGVFAKTPEEIQAAQNERSGACLPRGARMMLFLQKADEHGVVRYWRHPQASAESHQPNDYIKLPDGVQYAVDFHLGGELIPDSAPQTFPLKHDYPGRDMMRVWVRATEGLPVDEQKGLVEDLGLVRVSLWPTAANFNYDWTGFRTDYDRRIADQFGPDPLKFYREEIAPNLPPIGPKTTELQIILRHVIAGSYGDPNAAKEIAAAVFALDTSKSPKLRERVAEIVGGLGLLPNGNEAAVSLYTHHDPLIVQKALMNPFRPDEGKKYAKQVVALLDHEWEGVRLEALRILSMIYREPDKDWDMDKIGSRTYPSEELIQYWKEKVGK
ncbi:MAG: hypothetical protein HRF45_12870 [Fimbriimonadia bacterium]|jgi:hypothetical protein